MFTRVNGGKPPQTAPAVPQPSPATSASFLPLRIQPKLVLGAVDDPLERQADEVAERVVSRSPGPLGISALGSAAVQRCDEVNDDCSACEGMEMGRRTGKRMTNTRDEAAVDEDVRMAEEDDSGNEGEIGRRPKQHRIQGLVQSKPDGTAARAAGGAVPAGVETSIRQAQSGGRPLPVPVREKMEQSFGMGFGRVRVHTDRGADRLNRSLSARAFTTGPHIFFRQGENHLDSPAGERLLAHELTHVVQQGGAAPGPQGVAPRFLAPALGSADGSGLAQRKKFAGPQFAGGVNDNTTYSGHKFFNGGANANTGCGKHNQIRTAGEKKNGNTSDAGTPTDFHLYKNQRGGTAHFSRGAGLLYDPSTAPRGCAVTKMHLINHRLEDSDNTQRTADNILLGTKVSNNPRHLNDVEEPVINALGHASRANANYEKAMDRAKETKDKAGADVLFWKTAEAPAANVLTQLPVKAYLLEGDVTKGVDAAAADKKKDVEGVSLAVDANTPASNPRHLWLHYQVQANYAGFPQYVQDNITTETNHNNQRQKNDPLKKPTEGLIDDFTKTWATNAFPPDFTCTVDYYSATYKPGNIYLKETERHPMRTDQT